MLKMWDGENNMKQGTTGINTRKIKATD